jgi:site-specific recombinase XerD
MEQRTTLSLIFYIKRTKLLKNGDAPLYLKITITGTKCEMGLNRGVDPDAWDGKAGKMRGNTKQARLINDFLDAVKYKLHRQLQYLIEDDKEINAKALRNAYLGIVPSQKTILEAFDDHNNKMKRLIDIDYSSQTHARYMSSTNHVRAFIRKTYHVDDLPLDKINYNFLNDFELFFKTERACAHNTAMKHMKSLKKIIRIAVANQFIKINPFANYQITTQKTDRGFLTEEELAKIMNRKFDIERLENVRNCFIFSCFTGLAYIDLKNLSRDNIIVINGKKWLQINREKTNNRCNIPILPIAQRIIRKYEDSTNTQITGKLLPVLSNQKQNAYLKEIADLCGIKKKLTTHLARHTFATTVTLSNDVPIESISKMLGHKSLDMTRIYARLLDKKVGEDMYKLESIYK